MDSALRPRDIQARIRAGESPEDVAAAAQTTVDAIMPFAGPVVAERQHVARNALKGSVRRRSGDSSTAPRTLGEAAELYFSDHSLHDEDVDWDAWRRPDGRWALVASYDVDGKPRTAEFTHDLPGRYVVADNDEARVLTGEMRAPGAAGTARAQSRRLSPVPTQDELPLGDDAIELVRDRSAAPDEVADPADVSDPTAETADADWLSDAAEPAPDDVPLIEEPVEERVEERVAEPVEEPAAEEPAVEAVEAAEAAEAAPAEQADEPADEPVANTSEGKSASKRKGRSSVPSWDEIMFGGSAKED